MLTLHTLGSLNLIGADGEEITAILSQPKRCALLAYLALTRPSGLQRRDTLLTLFWPERDDAHARNALSQSLSYLRQHLSEEVIAGRGTEEVGLAPGAIWVDVEEFEAAITDGRWGVALDLYGGDFLRGFHVGGSWGFEEWKEGERERLREEAAGAAWALAREQIERGALVEAERTAQKALGLVWTGETPVRGFIEALAKAGDGAAALNLYERFCDRLKEELGLEPSLATKGVAEALRSGEISWASAGELPLTVPTPAALGPQVAEAPTLTTSPSRQKPRRSSRTVSMGLAAVVGMAAVAVALLLRGPDQDTGPPSIAVLPFHNISPDPEDAWFADGMQDEITSKLSIISGLKLRGRSSVMWYRENRPPIPQIGDELNVDFVLEGSARLVGDRVRLSVRLIEARRDEQVWSEVYQLDLSAENLFEVEARIAQQVAVKIGFTLTPNERDRVARVLTDNTDAYLVYIQGKARYLSERQGGFLQDDFESIRLFDRALELDPSFAPAHAYLALSLTYTPPDDQRYQRARHAAELALSILPGLGEARVALGRYHIKAGEAQEAIRQFQGAEEESPNLALAILELGLLQQQLGEFDTALRTLQRAENLDPRDRSIQRALIRAYVFEHRYDDAFHANEIRETGNPSYGFNHERVWLHLLRGEPGDARAVVDHLISSDAGVFYNIMPVFPFGVVRRWLTAKDRRTAIDEYWVTYGRDLSNRDRLLAKAIHEEEVGSRERARVFWDSLKIGFEETPPQSWYQYSNAVLIYEGLGEKDAAIKAAEALVRLNGAHREGEVEDRFYYVPSARLFLARVLAHFGEEDRAIDILEQELPAPSWLSVPILEIDPIWDPLRDHPRFQALLEKYADGVEH